MSQVDNPTQNGGANERICIVASCPPVWRETAVEGRTQYWDMFLLRFIFLLRDVILLIPWNS